MEPIANELIADYERNCQCVSLSQSILWVISYQFTKVSHMTLSDLDEIWFVGSPSGHM